MTETSKHKDDIQFHIGRLAGAMEAVQKDVSEIKQGMIPNGKERLEQTEFKVQGLVVWHKTATALGVMFVGLITWLGGFFNG